MWLNGILFLQKGWTSFNRRDGMQSKVSVRGQTVIPKSVRVALGITPDCSLHWRVEDHVAVVTPIPSDPVAASFGILEGKGSTFEDFLKERNEERRREHEKEERELKAWSAKRGKLRSGH